MAWHYAWATYLYCTWEESEIHHKVCLRFKEGYCPKGLREDDIIRRDVQKEISAAFCDKTDTDGMFGIVFGAAGTGIKVERAKAHL